MIVLLSNKWDVCIDFIVRLLDNIEHPYLRINTEDLVRDGSFVELEPFSFIINNKHSFVNLEDVNVIYNRRPGKPYDDTVYNLRPSRAIQEYVTGQWYKYLESITINSNIIWVNHPHNNSIMENKIIQLSKAVEIGFNIPRTLVTNCPNKLHKFMKRKIIIGKSLYSQLIEEENEDYFIYTNIIESINGKENEIRVSPAIYQEAIYPKKDYRITVIGDNVFVAKIKSNDNVDYLDWRTKQDGISFVKAELPREIYDKCVTYVKYNSLHYGAIDLVEKEGKYYFLEINPNGEWGWLQKPHGFKIAEAIADYLIKCDRN